MTATFTFTANAGTDEITTSAPHGQVTGDGPAVVRNVGGALPGGLTALLDVWLIRVSDTVLKLATSSANALLGTAIDITSAGTGTHHIEIGIPYRRPRTYAVGSQLKSADLNDNFDAWKALYALTTAQAETIWNGNIALAGDLAVGDDLSVTDDAAIGGDLAVTGAASAGGLLTASAGVLASAGPVSLQGVIAPTTLGAGSTHDYSPTGLASSIALRLDGASGAILTGIAGGTSGRVLLLVNIGTNNIVLNHDDAGSASANRFLLPNGSNVTVRPHGTALLWWDFGEVDTTKRGWRLIGGAQ